MIAEQSDEIHGVNTINSEHSSWKYLSSIVDEDVVSLSHTKVYVFSDSVSCLGKMSEYPLSNIVWEDKLTWFKSSSQYRALDTIDGDRMQLCNKVQEFLSKMSVEPMISQDGSSSCRCSTTSHEDLKTMNRNAN